MIGAGVVGSALGRKLREKGYPVVAVASRTSRSAEAAARFIGGEPAPSVLADPVAAAAQADLLLVTTPDRAVADAAAAIARGGDLAAKPLAVHCAGALPAEVLAPLRERGARIGSLHPLQTFATAEAALAALPGTVFGVEGDDDVRAELRRVVSDLGGVALDVRPGGKALYHAAAAIASNYTVVLAWVATALLEKLGASSADGLRALQPLFEGTVRNLASVGLPGALTGPIARGEVATVRGHIEALAREAPDALPLYAAAGRLAVRIAREKGTLAPEDADVLLTMLARHEA